MDEAPPSRRRPVTVALHEWSAMVADIRRAHSWRERLQQLFGRPREGFRQRPSAIAWP